jgi:hypothetical protein
MQEDKLSLLKELNKNDSLCNKISLCVSHLDKVASGSSRTVFNLDNERVIKIAKNYKGIKQNMNEYHIHKNSNNTLINKIFYKSDNYHIIIAQKARKLSHQEFINLINIKEIKNMYDLFLIINSSYKYLFNKVLYEQYYHDINIIKELLSSKDNFIYKLFDLTIYNDLLPIDMTLENVGFTDRLVLVDYGLTFKTSKLYNFNFNK